MGYNTKLEEMIGKGIISEDEAVIFSHSIKQLNPTYTLEPKKQLPNIMIGSILGIVILSAVAVIAAMPSSGVETIQDVSQSLNQPSATGDMGSTATSLITIFLLFSVPFSIIALAVIAKYNKLVELDENLKQSKAVVESTLQKRHDLVQDLAAVAKEAMNFEETTQTSVAGQRSSKAQDLHSVLQQSSNADYILPKLNAVSEAYPELTATTNMLALQTSLAEIEQDLQIARNVSVYSTANLNNELRSVLGSFVAKLYDFKEQNYFTAEKAAHNKSPISLN